MDIFTKTYQQAREDIQSGDIVLVRGNPKNLIQRLIMWASESVYAHVAIAFWIYDNCEGFDDNKRLMLVEAQGGTSRRVVNMSMYSDYIVDVYEAPKPWSSIRTDALDRLGQVDYGWVDAIYIGIRIKMQKWFSISLPRKDFHGETCSEFVNRVTKLTEQEDISPGEIGKVLVTQKIPLRVSVKN